VTRITTGSAKNKNLVSPNIPDFRAIQEVAKSAVFSVLGEKVVNSNCLDLFAGSGNMGIEALSRGASWCDFVDVNEKSVRAIEKNLIICNLKEKAGVYKQEAVKFVADTPSRYDLIFLDPSYSDVKHKYLMELLPEVLNENGIIVFFHGNNLNIDDLLEKSSAKVFDSRKYGKCFVDFLK